MLSELRHFNKFCTVYEILILKFVKDYIYILQIIVKLFVFKDVTK